MGKINKSNLKGNSSSSSSSNNNNNNNNNVSTSNSRNSLNKKILPLMSNSYYLSIFIRVIVGVLAIGYIHPDEYFQSPEITSSFMFNFKTFKPWEFSDDNPCRSIVIPLFNSGIPFLILNQIQELIDFITLNIFNSNGNQVISIINGNTLIIAPRIFMVCLSFSLDFYIFKICKHFKLSYRKSLSILSSCWLITIFHSRTFSNTIESLLVATLITLVLLYNEKNKQSDISSNSSNSNNNNNNKKNNNSKSYFHYFLKDLLIGSVVACGIFARFTFIFFATPLGIYLFYIFYTNKSKSCYLSILLILFGFMATCSFFILVDSIYFKYLDFNIALTTLNKIKTTIINQSFDSSTTTTSIFNQISNIHQHPLILDNFNSVQILSFVKNNLTFTPINSFLYNLDVKNLSDHGIHNRLTHLFVNFPMMVGPLVLVLFVEIISILKINQSSNNNNKDNNDHTVFDKKNHHHHHHHHGSNGNGLNNIGGQIKKEVFPKPIRILLVSIIIFGLFFLSLAPHQEPRFLLPLFFPLALISYRYFYFNKKSSKLLLMVWILFNMLLTIFFGFIHQGGVTPSLIFIGSNIIKKQHQLLDSKNSDVTIFYYHTYMPPRYLLGIDKNNENVNLVDVGGNDINTLIKAVENIKNSKIYILSPTKTILYQQYKDKTCQFTDSFWPHLTTEDPPKSIDESRLFMFECTDL